MKKSRQVILGLLFCFTQAIPLCAAVRLPAIISDNMVIQRDSTVAIWGFSDAGEDVAVFCSWNDQTVKGKASAAGKWKVFIKSPAAGSGYWIDVKGSNKIRISNVLAGEVWLCSGQSNMERQLGPRPPQKNLIGYKEDAAAANYPAIRMFTVKYNAAGTPQDDCTGKWITCTPESCLNFSAVGFYYARQLHNKLSIPVGMIHSSRGGSPAETWMQKEALKEKFPVFSSKTWKLNNTPYAPAKLYNGMIHPILGYGIKGAIWYQGENNVERPVQYKRLFPAMIANWRDNWGVGDFPFYYVQIAPYDYNKIWARKRSEYLREAQLESLSVINTGMAVTMDIGDVNDVHPTNKVDVGKRLALWALAKDYGYRDIAYSGPLYKSMRVIDNSIELSFDHADSGLKTRDGKELTDFTMAGSNLIFYPAKAVIKSDKVIVTSTQVAGSPVAVRYAYSNTATPNLCNMASLPASSFRTDSFASSIVPEPANFGQWWYDRHKAKLKRIDAGDVDLLFIGDSITHSWENPPGMGVWAKYYAHRKAVNIGYSADRTEQVLWRLHHGEIDGISPKVVVIMIGTNNSDPVNFALAHDGQAIASGIKAICGVLRKKLPQSKILLLSIFPYGKQPCPRRTVNENANAIAQKLADGKNIFYLDISQKFLNPDQSLDASIMPDYLHPNTEGYKIWARAMEPTLSSLLGDTPVFYDPVNTAVKPAVNPLPDRHGEYKWLQRHQAIIEENKKRDPQVIFLGDSITHYFGGFPKTPSVPKVKAHKVWEKYFAKYNPVNMGYGCDKTGNLLWHLDNGSVDGISPKVAVVMIGTNNMGLGNDSADQIVAGITVVCQRLQRKLPKTKVLLFGIFPRDFKPGTAYRKKIIAVNKAIARLHDGKRVFYRDIGNKFLDPSGNISPKIMPDGLHPNEKGYEIWAGSMYKDIEKLVGQE